MCVLLKGILVLLLFCSLGPRNDPVGSDNGAHPGFKPGTARSRGQDPSPQPTSPEISFSGELFTQISRRPKVHIEEITEHFFLIPVLLWKLDLSPESEKPNECSELSDQH